MLSFDALLKKDDKTRAEVLLVQAIATLSTQGEFAALTPEDVFARVVAYAFPVPEVIFFWDNGTTMVGDAAGRQMPRYQGRHDEALARLAEDGIDLTRVRNVYGSPANPVAWVRPATDDGLDAFRAVGERHAWREYEVTRARLAGVCRVCGGPIAGGEGHPAGWESEFGERVFPPPAVTLKFGAEFAHTGCLPEQERISNSGQGPPIAPPESGDG